MARVIQFPRKPTLPPAQQAQGHTHVARRYLQLVRGFARALSVLHDRQARAAQTGFQVIEGGHGGGAA